MVRKSLSVNKAVKKGKRSSAAIKPFKVKQAEAQKKDGSRTGQKNARAQSDPLKRQLKVQKALYAIADAASAVKDMQSFYKKLHKIVGKLMYAENFFIALYDEQTDLITWPYFVDSAGDQPNAPTPLSQFKGGTAYVLRTGQIVHASRAQSE